MTAPLFRSADPGFQRHVLLAPGEQWRCAWRDRGLGTVVAVAELAGMPTRYHVALDADPGRSFRAYPADVRRLCDPVPAAA